MKTVDERLGLQVDFDTHHCELTPAERDQYQDDLHALARQVADFPICDLHVLLEFNNRSNDYSVKTTLILPGATLVVNDHDAVGHAAFQRCLAVLSENVVAYKERMSQVPEIHRQEKGTHFEVAPVTEPDFAMVEAAVLNGDYDAFRTALLPYEDALRRRAGRWVERVPGASAKMGNGLDIGDVVEAVFLDAFDQFHQRPHEMRFGDWLERLIDGAVKSLQEAGEYLENVRLARTAQEQAARV